MVFKMTMPPRAGERNRLLRLPPSDIPALRILRTLETGAPSNLSISLRLRTGNRAFVFVRDAARPDDSPLGQAVLGPGFPVAVNLSAKRLAGAAAIEIVAGGTEEIEIEITRVTPGTRIRNVLRAVEPSLQGLLASWPSVRGTDYARWHYRYNWLSPQEQQDMLRAFAALLGDARQPVFIIGADADAIDRSRSSVLRSLGRQADIAQVEDARGLPGTLRPGPPFAVFVEAGTLVEPFAIALAVLWLAAHPGAALVYGDIEALDATGRVRPIFLAKFDETAAGQAPGMQARGLVATNTDLLALAQIATTAAHSFEAAALCASEAGLQVAHLPAVLCLLEPREPPGADAAPRPPGTRISKSGPISFIIPSRDNPGMLRRAVQSLHATAADMPVRFVIVDHASVRPETRDALAQLSRDFPVDVVRAEGDFNFSRLMNIGRAHVRGDLIFSVNDDIEARQEGWLEPLLHLLGDTRTGVAGPTLLFPDGSLQHAGVAIGFDKIAGHPGHMQSPHSPDLPPFLLKARQVSAVTGAMLGVRAEVWDAAGGWDENLPVDFNDVDFCLRIAALGFRNIYCPASVLVHHESASRGRARDSRHWPQMQRDQNAFIRRHWATLAHDPWLPPNLALRNKRLAFAEPPRRARLMDMPRFPAE